MSISSDYVHGSSEREGQRLSDQAQTLSAMLHCDVFFPAGTTVLEAGCGTGAQTISLARNNPEVNFVSVDICGESLEKARSFLKENNINIGYQ